MKRDYNKEIIQALKLKPRDGLALQENLHIRPDRMLGILSSMELDGLIYWDTILTLPDHLSVWRVKEL